MNTSYDHHDIIESQVLKSQNTNIIQIPIRLKYDLLKWLYLKTGLTIDKQTSKIDKIYYIHDQSGIGFSFIGGVDLIISESIRFNIEPELCITSLLPFNGDIYLQRHFLLTGINFNIGYRF